MSQHDPQSDALRRRLAALVAEAAKNETILRRAQERELLLLRSRTLEALFENLVDGMQASFGLDAVSVALTDPEHEIHHLLLFGEQERAAPVRGVLLADDLFALSPAYTQLRRARLGPYDAGQHGGLFPGAGTLRSVALLPLERDTELVGVLNFGSRDPERFTRHHATDFMDHLGTIAAFCLENAVNRARLTWSGLTDVLTGWHNRRYLNTRLPEEVARAQRSGAPLSCVLFDLDYFKRVNDEFGHLAGDAALREVARRAQKEIRASDVAARFGGEEFVVILPDTDVKRAATLGERIRAGVSASPVRLGENAATTLTVSVGVAQMRVDAPAAEPRLVGDRLLGRADAALFAAKEAGRNRVQIAQ